MISDYNQNKINELRKKLELPSSAQRAWARLKPIERHFFIKSAGVAVSVNDTELDKFSSLDRSRIIYAITRAAALAETFKFYVEMEREKAA